MDVKALLLLVLAAATLAHVTAGRQLQWSTPEWSTPKPAPTNITYPFCNNTTPCPATDGTTWYYCRVGGAVNGCKEVLPGSEGFNSKDCTDQCIYSAQAPFFCSTPPPCPHTPGTTWFYCSEGGAMNGCSSQLFSKVDCSEQCILSVPPEVESTPSPAPEPTKIETWSNPPTPQTVPVSPTKETWSKKSPPPAITPAPEDTLAVCDERPPCPLTPGTSWYYCQAGQAINGCMEVLNSTDGGFGAVDCSQQCLVHNKPAPSYDECEVAPPCPKTNGTSWYHCLKGGAVDGCSMIPFPDLDCSEQCLFSNPGNRSSLAPSPAPAPFPSPPHVWHKKSPPPREAQTPVASPSPKRWTYWKKPPPPAPKPPVANPGCVTTCLHNNNFFQLYDDFCSCKVCRGGNCCCQDPFAWSCVRIGKKSRRTCYKLYTQSDCSITCKLP